MDLKGLSNEKLLEEAKSGNEEAKDLFFHKNKKLAHGVAQRFRKSNIPYEDLVGLANLGMVKAFESFDSKYEVKVSTYFYPMMIGEIRRYIRDNNIGLKYPRSVKEIAHQIINRELTKDEPEEIIRHIDHEQANIKSIKAALDYIACGMGGILNLEKTVYENDGDPITLADTVGVDGEIDSNIMIADLLSPLNERERKIYYLRYFKDKTQSEIGNEFGLSQVQISRLMKAAKKKILKSNPEYAFRKDEKTVAKVDKGQFMYVYRKYSLEAEEIKLSYYDMSLIFNTSEQTIYNHARRYKDGEYEGVKEVSPKPLLDKIKKVIEQRHKKKEKQKKEEDRKKPSDVKVSKYEVPKRPQAEKAEAIIKEDRKEISMEEAANKAYKKLSNEAITMEEASEKAFNEELEAATERAKERAKYEAEMKEAELAKMKEEKEMAKANVVYDSPTPNIAQGQLNFEGTPDKVYQMLIAQANYIKSMPANTKAQISLSFAVKEGGEINEKE